MDMPVLKTVTLPASVMNCFNSATATTLWEYNNCVSVAQKEFRGTRRHSLNPALMRRRPVNVDAISGSGSDSGRWIRTKLMTLRKVPHVQTANDDLIFDDSDSLFLVSRKITYKFNGVAYTAA